MQFLLHQLCLWTRGTNDGAHHERNDGPQEDGVSVKK